MLLMIEKKITERICYTIYRHSKANNKYMKDDDMNEESLYLRVQILGCK